MATNTNAALVTEWMRQSPPAGFPLGIHKPTAQFCKKIAGRVVYFGKLPDWRKAWDTYDREREALERGEDPRATSTQIVLATKDGRQLATTNAAGQVTLHAVVNLFLAREGERRTRTNHVTGKPELSDTSYFAEKRACERALQFMVARKGEGVAVDDIVPDDWSAFRHALYSDYRLASAAVNHHVIYVRRMARWAFDNRKATNLREPFAFCDSFEYVPKAEKRMALVRREREHGPKVFPLDQVRIIVDELYDWPVLLSMFLLSINCGFTAIDLSELRADAIDWRGWIDYDRIKTGVRRFCVLWPETLDALKRAYAMRPAPADGVPANHVYLTKWGQPWVRNTLKKRPGRDDVVIRNDSITFAFSKFLADLDVKYPNLDDKGGMKFKRMGVAFGTGRHTHRTATSSHPDREAKLWIMGHAQKGMDEHYVHLDDKTKLSIARVAFYARSYFLGDDDTTSATTTVRDLGPLLLEDASARAIPA